MWKPEHRRSANRRGLRYNSNLSDAEWALVAPLIRPAKRGGRLRTVDAREVLNAIFYVLWTGCEWKAQPRDLPPRSTVWDYLDLWEWHGTLTWIHHALYIEVRDGEGREASPTTAIIDSQTAKGANLSPPKTRPNPALETLYMLLPGRPRPGPMRNPYRERLRTAPAHHRQLRNAPVVLIRLKSSCSGRASDPISRPLRSRPFRTSTHAAIFTYRQLPMCRVVGCYPCSLQDLWPATLPVWVGSWLRLGALALLTALGGASL